jgi:hypothetical protein
MLHVSRQNIKISSDFDIIVEGELRFRKEDGDGEGEGENRGGDRRRCHQD